MSKTRVNLREEPSALGRLKAVNRFGKRNQQVFWSTTNKKNLVGSQVVFTEESKNTGDNTEPDVGIQSQYQIGDAHGPILFSTEKSQRKKQTINSQNVSLDNSSFGRSMIQTPDPYNTIKLPIKIKSQKRCGSRESTLLNVYGGKSLGQVNCVNG